MIITPKDSLYSTLMNIWQVLYDRTPNNIGLLDQVDRVIDEFKIFGIEIIHNNYYTIDRMVINSEQELTVVLLKFGEYL